ncbi:hypothetical protein MACJ_003632 [Theileria orientalis]|uniref:Uncharacterized protein n=1 Tax=Theileria orientalis TaxID=68886 RepID=A0A976XIV6_THEOR|nr:hypothetical protein MACJ_003632 [Theileria orientalis]
MCNYCHSCCCDDDRFAYSWDEFSDICDVCNNISDDLSDYDAVNEEDSFDCCGICDICGCAFCDLEPDDSSIYPKYCDSFNNIRYCSTESTPVISKRNSGIGLVQNSYCLNKKKPLQLFKKDFCCFSMAPKSNIHVLPLPQGYKSVEVIAKRVKPKSKSSHGLEKTHPGKKNKKMPKLKISTPK